MTGVAGFTSVLRVELDEASSGWWPAEGGAIRRTLAAHYGADVEGAALTPPPDPAALRTALRAAAPKLTALTDRVRHAFDVDGAASVLVPRLGLSNPRPSDAEPTEAEVDDMRIGVFAFAMLLGDPTANVPSDEVFWDVRDHGNCNCKVRHQSFSENDREADYHADNGSLRRPERFFLLYSVQAAECGGGVSMIRDGRALREQVAAAAGPDVLRTLSEAIVPRRIPKALRPYADPGPDGHTYHPILTPHAPPLWRWRKDKIDLVFDKYPDYATPALRTAVDAVQDVLVNAPDQVNEVVPTDGVIVINNHLALHGRTAFTDSRRHLLRLRFQDPTGRTF